METVIIDTKCGKIKGRKMKDSLLFSSIPYAVTERFEAPKPVDKWELFDSTQKQVNCPQFYNYRDLKESLDDFYYKEFYFERDSDFAESPMTLTITTPVEAKNCSVIVYIHGGSFENGCIEDLPFGGCEEYAKRGIILVSVGYRLNVFGLFDSQNYMLQDQFFAIKWVYENIETFGGNKDNIVLMGQSAGAMCISDLLLYKPLKEYVKAAIIISGAGVIPRVAGPKDQKTNADFWQKVVKDAGCKNIEEAKKVDGKILWESWYKNAHEQKAPVSILEPSIDGTFISDVPQNIRKKGEDVDIPLMIGVTSQDMYPYMILDMALRMGIRNARQKRSNVYCYYFDITLPGDNYKAFHSSDLWYLFGNMDKSKRPFTQKDKDISKMMIDYVTNFVNKHDPNGEGLVKWQKITRYDHDLRLFSYGKRSTVRPFKARGKLFYNMFFDKGPF